MLFFDCLNYNRLNYNRYIRIDLILEVEMKNLLLIVILISLSACQGKDQVPEGSVSGEDFNQSERSYEKLDKGDDLMANINGIIEEGNDVHYEINPANWSVEPITESAVEKVVLLTIDDAPEHYALEMAETLDNLDAKAIFFVNGHFLETDKQQDILRKIHEMGFAIGNHTYTHPNLNELSNEEQRVEITALNDLVEDIIGERPVFFRAPFGANTETSNKVAEEEGMVVMNWTYGYDWEQDYLEKQALAEIMVNTDLLRNGANLLMHDREWTAAALPEIVTGLRDKGFEMVDPDQIKTPNQS